MAEMTENLIRLRSVHGVGNVILWRLLRHFGDSDRLLGADAASLTQVKGVSKALAERILRAGREDPRPELEHAVAMGVDVIPYDDPSYPKPLLHSYDPPVLLYVRGRLTPADQVAVGIVGTRHASPYGRENAVNLSGALARGGYTVVSGLARGVDTFAHIGALDAGGRTVGVLGCGFDHMYPEENRDLALEMSRSGAVISEFSMATRPARDTFPVRNRIIAGMSLGLLVIEAPLRSGSLITARLANEMGRTVFAVPGRMNDARSEGCNKLIRDGATMVTGVDDIFSELNPSLPVRDFPQMPAEGKARRASGGSLFDAPPEKRRTEPPVPAPKPTPPEAADSASGAAAVPGPALKPEYRDLLRHVSTEWLTLDDITASAGLAPGKAAAALTMLEMLRLVEQGPGRTYRLHDRAGG